MVSNSPTQENIEIVYNCINLHLKINTRNIPLLYVNLHEFYLCLKSNIQVLVNNPQLLRELCLHYCEIIPGLYKYREKTVFIKNSHKYDLCLLLTELLHAKSIFQHHKSTEDWIKEGLIHLVAKILCEKCNIEYIPSGHSHFFVIWEHIYREHDLNLLRNIIFAEDIRITKSFLKNLFNYHKDNILEISFEEAKNLLNISE